MDYKPFRDRATKAKPNARCCWVCGKLGGFGFTSALRIAGYRMQKNEMGYAHVGCMKRALAKVNPNGHEHS